MLRLSHCGKLYIPSRNVLLSTATAPKRWLRLSHCGILNRNVWLSTAAAPKRWFEEDHKKLEELEKGGFYLNRLYLDGKIPQKKNQLEQKEIEKFTKMVSGNRELKRWLKLFKE